jgi:hypothetical protein
MRKFQASLSCMVVMWATLAQAGSELSFARCKPISAYRVEIANPQQLTSFPPKQQEHVELFLRNHAAEGRPEWPVYLLQPRPEMTDLTFVLEARDCPDLCLGHAYTGSVRRISEIPFRYKKNFVDHVRILHDGNGRWYANDSRFRSVSFKLLSADSQQVVFFERSALNVRGPYIDRSEAWTGFFPRARFRFRIEKETREATVARKCLNLDQDNPGTNSPGFLQGPGEPGYPFPFLSRSVQ